MVRDCVISFFIAFVCFFFSFFFGGGAGFLGSLTKLRKVCHDFGITKPFCFVF